jgi:hypothetical protein
MLHVIRHDEGNQLTYGLSVVTCWSRRGDLNPRPADCESPPARTEPTQENPSAQKTEELQRYNTPTFRLTRPGEPMMITPWSSIGNR